MGLNYTLSFRLFLFFLLLLISFFASPSSSLQPKAEASSKEPTQYQVFKIKNTRPFLLNEEHTKEKKRRKINNFGSRPFAVMLPKGFVPPSGSSSCHNDVPDSVTSYCDYSLAKP